jgi:hypothetical protein
VGGRCWWWSREGAERDRKRRERHKGKVGDVCVCGERGWGDVVAWPARALEFNQIELLTRVNSRQNSMLVRVGVGVGR